MIKNKNKNKRRRTIYDKRRKIVSYPIAESWIWISKDSRKPVITAFNGKKLVQTASDSK